MTGSTYLDYDKTLNKAFKMLKDDKLKSFGLLVICGINLGLRIDDLSKLSFEELRKDSIDIIEGKTKKKRTLKVNEHIKLALTYFEDDLKGYAFTSQKGTPFSSQHINRMLKQHFKGVGNGTVSSHSLRKCFGRRVWENDKQSERSLIYLSQLFNHSSTQVTRIYLGIQQEELDDIYLNL
ncbi:tyrosine-type recombinase/integrase [Pseudotamlana agarivorans]|uniref:tyrosine-type recombinase/integrase n=1 Tax=Pseudotamlana agarivorans TaxID=481183 RepID=UPI000835925F|nr:tyrosine-type recombinase/integrase [Tamlana agarivorans]